MEHDQKVSIDSTCDELPLLSSNYPLFIVQNFIDKQAAIDTEFFSTLHDPLIKYQCQIPELNGKRIRGCFYGWLILSNHPYNTSWSLWNPLTLKIIDLPNLVLYTAYGVSLNECCLTAPPGDPNSILIVTRCDESSIFISQRDSKRRRYMKWTEMSYAKQLKKLTYDGEYLISLTCCNGKIYALNCDSSISPVVIQVEIVVKDYPYTIELLMFGNCPSSSSFSSDSNCCLKWANFLKGYGTELFCIKVGVDEKTKKCGDVSLFQLDTASIKLEELECLKKWDLSGEKVEQVGEDDLKDLRITQVKWEEMNDLNDGIFYVDLGRDWSIFYNPAVDSELGGYIHIRYEMDGILYLYHVKDRTIVVSSMPSRVVSTTRVLMLEGRLEKDHECKEKDERLVMVDEIEHNGSRLYRVLEIIMEYCVGVEYLNFRATCKLGRLAAPLIGWRNESSLRRWHNYSLNSPWLMVADEGVVTFIDPLSGDKYFMKNSKLSLSLVEDTIYCSRYGWLLCESREYECPVFFNPVTNDVRKLPVFNNGDVKSLCFSAPPTSYNWIVAGFAIINDRHTLICFVSGEPSWRLIQAERGAHFDLPLFSSTFIDGDLFGVYKEGQYNLCSSWDLRYRPIESVVLAKAPESRCSSTTQYFMMNCDEYILVVIVGEFGEVEVFRRNHTENEWKRTDSVGRHTIYIGGTTSVCVDAKTREMENKIVFPNLVWYSLKTRTYHTFDGKLVNNGFGGLLEAKTHAWIEPSWSKLDVN